MSKGGTWSLYVMSSLYRIGLFVTARLVMYRAGREKAGVLHGACEIGFGIIIVLSFRLSIYSR